MQQGPSPFFSNDWLGAMKVLGTVVLPIIGVLWAVVWKMMHGPQVEQLRSVKEDHGKRLRLAERHRVRSNAEMANMRRQIDQHQFQLSDIKESLGELKARVESAERATLDAKTEIIQAFQQRTDTILREVHELDKSVVEVRTSIGLRGRKPRREGDNSEETR